MYYVYASDLHHTWMCGIDREERLKFGGSENDVGSKQRRERTPVVRTSKYSSALSSTPVVLLLYYRKSLMSTDIHTGSRSPSHHHQNYKNTILSYHR